MAQGAGQGGNAHFQDKNKPAAVRTGNITAARAVADAIRTSLGPRGMVGRHVYEEEYRR